jgi:maltooligosyltrehalose trehalohydrolase
MSSSTEAPPATAPAADSDAVLGALPLAEGGTAFRVWAPHAERIDVVLPDRGGDAVRLERRERGYFAGRVESTAAGDRYRFRLDGARELPDPASRFQPDGVHGPSAVVAADFEWRANDWTPPPLAEYVIYELHIGTFTAEGTFDAAADRLEQLRELGITAVELMPLAQFPGARNWGYDGVFPFATQNSYGGPHQLKRFIDRCHELGLAAILDVVYNHLGPEGNHLGAFGPYFTDTYRTPWGDALNFDGPASDEVREYFIRNALQWTIEFRFDALRLDAVHAILDTSAQPFLQQLATRVHDSGRAIGRDIVLIAESDLGDPRMIRGPERGGMGMDGQWLDDFHHALHALLTGERSGYYADFGSTTHFVRCLREGFVYSGQFSEYRQRAHGAPAPDASPAQFVVCSQNHDQIGNRMKGERLSSMLDHEQLKLAAAATLLSPFTPLLYMGEEYGDPSPFPYFVSHSDPELVEAVRAGRREEFEAFAWAGEPPDPQAEETFDSARLCWYLREQRPHRELLEFYRELIAVRRELPPHERVDADSIDVRALGDGGETVLFVRACARRRAAVLLHFSDRPALMTIASLEGSWQRRLDSADERWGGSGGRRRAAPAARPDGLRLELAPHSAVVLVPEATD